MVCMGKSATALDKTKPWGIVVQTDGMQPYYFACVPVANADDIVEIGADTVQGWMGWQ